MERTEVLDMMGELKLYGMRNAYDEALAAAVKRKHEPQHFVGDLLKAEISEKQARSIKYQLTIAKLPLAKDIDDFTYKGTPINESLVRDLADWPAEDRALLEQTLARHYFVRVITAIDSIELKYGLLTFQVQTDRGPICFTMRNSHSQAQEYGENGKLLLDVDDNRYLLPDVDALARRQQLLFRSDG